MPSFSIRPCRRFPVQSAVSYNAGPFLKLPMACILGFWFLITLLLLTSGSVYAEWVTVEKQYQIFNDWNAVMSRGPVETKWVAVEQQYQTHGLQTVYFDPDTIRREGNLVKMVTIVDWKWMQGNRSPSRFSSTKVKKQFDCVGKRLRLLVITDYYGPMGTGTRVAERVYDSDGDWSPVEPESLNQGLWTVACGMQ